MIGRKKVTLVGVVMTFVMTVGAAALVAAERKGLPAPEGHPLDKIISGYEFRTAKTQAIQDDDFENPAFIWVESGEELWSQAEGKAGKSCESCHNDASESMAKAGAQYPKWDEASQKPINLEQRINKCRTENMQADAWKWESKELLSMTAYVRTQSRGQPVNVQQDGPMQSWAEKGKEIYYTRYGQLDLSCAQCHENNYGNYVRADFLSQGQTNGFPTYRMKWQKLGSLHRRFKGCMKNIRANPFKVGGDEFIALEVYLGYRGQGLAVEAPSFRN